MDSDSGRVHLSEGDQPILVYNYQTVNPPDGLLETIDAGNRKYAQPRSDYIHPLFGPDGESLTLDWSRDHPHHRGIYWAWPEVDYRGDRGDLHALQNVFARPTGKIKLQSGSDFAEIQAENLWLWEDKTPIVREEAVIRAHRSQEQGRNIGLRLTFVALDDDVAIARRGTDKYGGLNMRLSPVQGLKIVFHTDPADAVPRRAWADSVGIREGGAASVGLAVFEKSTNPAYPGEGVEFPALPWFQTTFPAAGTRHVLKKDRPLVLEYRLWIRRGGEPTEGTYVQHWGDYSHHEAVSPASQ
jgi:hypothetical protein